MSQTDPEGRRSIIDHEQRQRSRSEYYDRQKQIRSAIEDCSRAISNGDPHFYAYVGKRLRDDIIPAVDAHTPGDWAEYDRRLSGSQSWDWISFCRFRDNPDEYIRYLSTGPGVSTATISQHTARGDDSTTTAKKTVQRALESVVTVCEEEDIVMETYSNRVDAVGFSLKLGEQLKRGDMDFGDPVKAVTRAQGALKSFFAGDTGTGKTVAAARQFEDYYRAQFEGGRRYKCIDYVGLGRAENIMYDVHQQQDDLIGAREEDHGLRPSFADIDAFDPEMDLYVPLSTDLRDERLPYNTAGEEFVPRPFTIPASDLSEGLLASLIASQVAKRREQTIRDAYQVVDNRMNDWALADLAEEIRHRDELSDKHIKDALRVLRSLQDSGFIRTKADEHTLDWDEIMYSPERVTAFSQSLLPDEFEQLMVVAHLLDKHWSYRWARDDYPTAAVWLRELWEIAPHQGQRSKRPDRETAVIKFIIDRLTKMMRKPRDISTHFLCDTQEPNDVEKAVREQFNRFLIFDSNHSLVESVMEWEGQPRSDAFDFLDTMSGHAGRGGIIGGCEPAIDANYWGVSPIQFSPPSWHHHDKEHDGSGWSARIDYTTDEELRQPDWDTAVPADLEVPISVPDDEGGDQDGTTDKTDLRESIKNEARELYREGLSRAEIVDRVPNNPDTNEPYDETRVSQWCSDISRRNRAKAER